MPTIEQNLNAWNKDYGWSKFGEEWSEAWGGSASQWFGAILPRIHAFVPGDTILEIAPGFGRWTQFLKNLCNRLILVDLSERCIETCKSRFASNSHIAYHVNDGKSLAMVSDESVDFVFSFDSLVHAESDVLLAYLSELAKKLKPSGVGFLHHSNLGVYLDKTTNELPPNIANPHWWAKTMSAELFEKYCNSVGLQCVGQEAINWEIDLLTDCFSTFSRNGSIWSRPTRRLENDSFMVETRQIQQMAQLYTAASFPEKSRLTAVEDHGEAARKQ